MKNFLQLIITFVLSVNSLFAQYYECGISLQEEGYEISTAYTQDICVDGLGNIYYLKNEDIYKNHVLWVDRISEDPYLLFGSPIQIAVSEDGHLYVYDYKYSQIFKISPQGVVTHIAGKRYFDEDKDTTALAAGINTVQDMCVDKNGVLYFVTYKGLRKLDEEKGLVTTIATSESTDIYSGFESITIGNQGEIYVLEESEIYRYDSEMKKEQLSGLCVSSYYSDDTVSCAGLGSRRDIHYSDNGSIYIVEESRIRRISPSYHVSTVIGYPNGSSDESKILDYDIGEVEELTVDKNGDLLFFGDGSLKRVTKDLSCDQEAVQVQTIAGNGNGGEVKEGVGRQAEFRQISGICKDKEGNIYIADGSEGTVLKMDKDDSVSIFFQPSFKYPVNAMTANDNYVVLGYSDRILVLDKFGAQKLYEVAAVFRDFRVAGMDFISENEVLFTDYYYHNIKLLNVVTGEISIYSGGVNEDNGNKNIGDVVGSITEARFYSPNAIDITENGDIYIGDKGNNVIKKISEGKVEKVLEEDVTTPGLENIDKVQIDANGLMYYWNSYQLAFYRIALSKQIPEYIAGTVFNGGVAPINRYVDGRGSVARIWNLRSSLLMDNEIIFSDAQPVLRKVTGFGNGITALDKVYEEDQIDLHVFPNPAFDEINLESESEYVVYDSQQNALMNGKSDTVKLLNLSSGIYFIYIKNVNKMVRFIKL